MRVLVTLLALVTAPFLASVSQEPAGNPPCWTVEHGAARDSHSQGRGHHWALGQAKHECDPPVGDGGGGGGGTVGFAEIDGMSFNDAKANGWFDGGDSPLAGWTMQLSVNGPVGTTTVTDALGNYAFPGLSAGTYLVCEVVQTGWRLTEP